MLNLSSSFLLSLLLLLGPLTEAEAAGDAPFTKTFWVWDLNVMPPGNRQATARLRAVGSKTLIYVEDKLWETNVRSDFVARLFHRLEKQSPPNSIAPGKGIVALEEALYAPLPTPISGDNRLIVLFADLGQYKNNQFDGFFNSYDQIPEEEAQKDNQHSNEGNIIYINGLRQTESYTTGVIAHELQHLLHFRAGPPEGQDIWLSETLGESAMLVNGYATDQGHANTFAKQPEKYSLVSQTYVQYGQQLLFSSFLLDSMPNKELGLSFLTSRPKGGMQAVEDLFKKDGTNFISFDIIFSNYISYLFENEGKAIPFTLPNPQLRVPTFSSFAKISSFPAEVEGSLMPYTFISLDLPEALPPSAVVNIEVLKDANSKECAASSSVLWKPLGPKRLAVYSIGCENHSNQDAVKFRLRILNRPLLMPESPLRILP